MTEMSFLGSTTFPPPKEFTGKKEQFDEFCYKLRAYMNLINTGNSQIFKMIEDDPTHIIHDEDLHEVQQVRAEDGTVTQVVISDSQGAHMASGYITSWLHCVQGRLAQRYAEKLI